MGTVVPKSDLPVFYVGIITVSNSGRSFEWLNSLDWATIAGSLDSGRVSIHPCRVYRKHSFPEIQVFLKLIRIGIDLTYNPLPLALLSNRSMWSRNGTTH
jgi:hypothetical protein